MSGPQSVSFQQTSNQIIVEQLESQLQTLNISSESANLRHKTPEKKRVISQTANTAIQQSQDSTTARKSKKITKGRPRSASNPPTSTLLRTLSKAEIRDKSAIESSAATAAVPLNSEQKSSLGDRASRELNLMLEALKKGSFNIRGSLESSLSINKQVKLQADIELLNTVLKDPLDTAVFSFLQATDEQRKLVFEFMLKQEEQAQNNLEDLRNIMGKSAGKTAKKRKLDRTLTGVNIEKQYKIDSTLQEIPIWKEALATIQDLHTRRKELEFALEKLANCTLIQAIVKEYKDNNKLYKLARSTAMCFEKLFSSRAKGLEDHPTRIFFETFKLLVEEACIQKNASEQIALFKLLAYLLNYKDLKIFLMSTDSKRLALLSLIQLLLNIEGIKKQTEIQKDIPTLESTANILEAKKVIISEQIPFNFEECKATVNNPSATLLIRRAKYITHENPIEETGYKQIRDIIAKDLHIAHKKLFIRLNSQDILSSINPHVIDIMTFYDSTTRFITGDIEEKSENIRFWIDVVDNLTSHKDYSLAEVIFNTLSHLAKDYKPEVLGYAYTSYKKYLGLFSPSKDPSDKKRKEKVIKNPPYIGDITDTIEKIKAHTEKKTTKTDPPYLIDAASQIRRAVDKFFDRKKDIKSNELLFGTDIVATICKGGQKQFDIDIDLSSSDSSADEK